MKDLFNSFGGWTNIIFALIVGYLVYSLAGQSILWGAVAGFVALIIGSSATSTTPAATA